MCYTQFDSYKASQIESNDNYNELLIEQFRDIMVKALKVKSWERKQRKKIDYDVLITNYINTVCYGQYNSVEEMADVLYKGKMSVAKIRLMLYKVIDDVKGEFE